MANLGPSVWYVDSAQWSNVTAWPANTPKAAGTLIRQNAAPSVGNERVFVAIVGGNTTNGSEPVWTVTKGAKNTDNTVTWQECTGQPGVNGDLTNCPTWAQQHASSVAVTLGFVIQDAAADYLFIVTTAGNIGSSEPTWNKTAGVTTNDNTAVWTCIGTVGSFGKWAAPFARLQSAVVANWGAAGNTFFVGDDHAETQTTSMTVAFPGTAASPNFVYCVDHTVNTPPGTGDLKATGTVTTTVSSGNFLWEGQFYLYGLTLAATSTTGSSVHLGVSAGDVQIYEECAFHSGATSGANGAISIANSTTSNVTLINSTVQMDAASSSMSVAGAFTWKNTPTAVAGGTVPTTLISTASGVGPIVLRGVDLSALGSGAIFGPGTTNAQPTTIIDCKLGSGAVLSGAPGSRLTSGGIFLVSSDSGTGTYRHEQYRYEGTQTTDTTIVRTGGASDGTTPISRKHVTTAGISWSFPFEGIPVSIWNTVISPTVRTVTIYGLASPVSFAALPNNDQVWAEIEYYGSSSTPQASFATNTKANGLASGSPLTADSTSVWNSAATARANTTVYAVGAAVSVTGNNRVFICTNAGSAPHHSAGSQPDYSGAVDGGSISDGDVTFTACWRFSFQVPLTAQLVGYLKIYPKAGGVSQTFWIDPLPVLS